MPLLEIAHLEKSYQHPDGSRTPVVSIESFSLDAGEQVALEGTSGSGKTTLLNMIAGILRADAGSIRLGGIDIVTLGEAQRDRFRAEHLGYVFQTFNLLQGYTALENVVLGMMFGPGPDPRFAESLLIDLGLGDRVQHRPKQLSIGQQQRVAVARALANRPRLVLADEPTGNLDSHTAAEALDLMRRACREQGAALLMVSHDPRMLAQFDRRERLQDLNQHARGEEPTS